jgi:hypothetical protein
MTLSRYRHTGPLYPSGAVFGLYRSASNNEVASTSAVHQQASVENSIRNTAITGPLTDRKPTHTMTLLILSLNVSMVRVFFNCQTFSERLARD